MALGFVDKLLGRYREKDTTTVIIQRQNSGFRNWFTDNPEPEVVDYWNIYGQQYGELPNVQLFIIQPDGTLKLKQDIAPEYIPENGHIYKIRFDLGQPLSGFIVLS